MSVVVNEKVKNLEDRVAHLESELKNTMEWAKITNDTMSVHTKALTGLNNICASLGHSRKLIVWSMILLAISQIIEFLF